MTSPFRFRAPVANAPSGTPAGTYTLSGDFTTSTTLTPGTSGYNITSFTGTFTDTAISYTGAASLYPGLGTDSSYLTSLNGQFTYDNQFYPGGTAPSDASGADFDNNGLLLLVGPTGSPQYIVSLFGSNGPTISLYGQTYGEWWYNLGWNTVPADALNITVPESGSQFMLVLCGFGLAGGFFYKAKQSGLLNPSQLDPELVKILLLGNKGHASVPFVVSPAFLPGSSKLNCRSIECHDEVSSLGTRATAPAPPAAVNAGGCPGL
jgi:hypothetical protein